MRAGYSGVKGTIRHFRRLLLQPVHYRAVLNDLRDFHAQGPSLEELVDLALDFPGRGYYKIRTKQIPFEILSLTQAVARIKPRTILEIGTSNGGTLILWANLASKKVVTCDLYHLRAKKSLYRTFPPPGSDCEVQALTGDSHLATFKERVVEALDGEPVDFLFLDGDHTEQGVEADFDLYMPLVRPGGIIAFHDIVANQPVAANQVHRFWTRQKHLYDTVEWVHHPDQCGYGIGMIRVPVPTISAS